VSKQTENDPKTIEEKWQEYLQLLLQKDVPPEVIATCRVSFWGGAAALASILPLSASRDDFIVAMESFIAELERA
jgi:hypothetical protein